MSNSNDAIFEKVFLKYKCDNIHNKKNTFKVWFYLILLIIFFIANIWISLIKNINVQLSIRTVIYSNNIFVNISSL